MFHSALSVISPTKRNLHFGDTKRNSAREMIDQKETIYTLSRTVKSSAHYVIEKTVFSTGLIIFSGLIWLSFICCLQRTFLNYQRQVVDIDMPISSQMVIIRKRTDRDQGAELLLIMTTTNTMLIVWIRVFGILMLGDQSKDANTEAASRRKSTPILCTTPWNLSGCMRSRSIRKNDIIYEFNCWEK